MYRQLTISVSAALLLVTLTACAHTGWTRAGASQANLESDRLFCEIQANRYTLSGAGEPAYALMGLLLSNSQFNSCMEGLGWIEGKKAVELAVAPEENGKSNCDAFLAMDQPNRVSMVRLHVPELTQQYGLTDKEALCVHDRAESIERDLSTGCLAGLTDEQIDRSTDLHIASCAPRTVSASNQGPESDSLPPVGAMKSSPPDEEPDSLIRSINGRIGTIIFFTDDEIDPNDLSDSLDKCPAAQPQSTFAKNETRYVWFCTFIVPDGKFAAGSANFTMALRRKRNNSLVTWIPGATLHLQVDESYGILLNGYGAVEAGQIDTGEYRLEIFSESIKVGEASFVVD